MYLNGESLNLDRQCNKRLNSNTLPIVVENRIIRP